MTKIPFYFSFNLKNYKSFYASNKTIFLGVLTTVLRVVFFLIYYSNHLYIINTFGDLN